MSRKKLIRTNCSKCAHPVLIGGNQDDLFQNPSYRPAAGGIGGPIYCEDCYQELEDRMFPDVRTIETPARGDGPPTSPRPRDHHPGAVSEDP